MCIRDRNTKVNKTKSTNNTVATKTNKKHDQKTEVSVSYLGCGVF